MSSKFHALLNRFDTLPVADDAASSHDPSSTTATPSPPSTQPARDLQDLKRNTVAHSESLDDVKRQARPSTEQDDGAARNRHDLKRIPGPDYHGAQYSDSNEAHSLPSFVQQMRLFDGDDGAPQPGPINTQRHSDSDDSALYAVEAVGLATGNEVAMIPSAPPLTAHMATGAHGGSIGMTARLDAFLLPVDEDGNDGGKGKEVKGELEQRRRETKENENGWPFKYMSEVGGRDQEEEFEKTHVLGNKIPMRLDDGEEAKEVKGGGGHEIVMFGSDDGRTKHVHGEMSGWTEAKEQQLYTLSKDLYDGQEKHAHRHANEYGTKQHEAVEVPLLHCDVAAQSNDAQVRSPGVELEQDEVWVGEETEQVRRVESTWVEQGLVTKPLIIEPQPATIIDLNPSRAKDSAASSSGRLWFGKKRRKSGKNQVAK